MIENTHTHVTHTHTHKHTHARTCTCPTTSPSLHYCTLCMSAGIMVAVTLTTKHASFLLRVLFDIHAYSIMISPSLPQLWLARGAPQQQRTNARTVRHVPANTHKHTHTYVTAHTYTHAHTRGTHTAARTHAPPSLLLCRCGCRNSRPHTHGAAGADQDPLPASAHADLEGVCANLTTASDV